MSDQRPATGMHDNIPLVGVSIQIVLSPLRFSTDCVITGNSSNIQMTLGSVEAGEVQRHLWCAHVLSRAVVRSTRSPGLVRTGRRERATRTPKLPTLCFFIHPVHGLCMLNTSYRRSAPVGISIQIKNDTEQSIKPQQHTVFVLSCVCMRE